MKSTSEILAYWRFRFIIFGIPSSFSARVARGSCTLARACFTAYVSKFYLLLCRCYTYPFKFSLHRFNPISFTTVEDTRSYVVGQEEKKTTRREDDYGLISFPILCTVYCGILTFY